MKKTYIASLSLVITAGLLTSCGIKEQTEVSAMQNNVIAETESVTETESMTETESATESESMTESDCDVNANNSVDSTGVDGQFAEGEERGEASDNLGETDNLDASDNDSNTDKTEQTSKNKIRDAGFTIDDFEYDPSKSDFFNDVEEMKGYLQLCIDDYESGKWDYHELMGALADLGIDNTKLIEEYEKKQSVSSSTSSTSQQESYNPEDYGLMPEGPVEGFTREPLHPEYSDTIVW